jgi:hypothetical protein
MTLSGVDVVTSAGWKSGDVAERWESEMLFVVLEDLTRKEY